MKIRTNRSDSLNAWQSISYALPVIPAMMLLAPLSIIQGIYAKHYGIALSTLAAIILFSRMLDAISDPIIGFVSDRYYSKHGNRKPFIAIGSILLLLSGYFLYIPPENVNSVYFAIWFVLFYIAYTVFEIPHITWPCDISTISEDKAKLYSFRIFTGYCGLLLFYSIPLFPSFDSTEITPETLKVTFIVSLCLTVPFLIQAMRFVPSKIDDKRHTKVSSFSNPTHFLSLWTEMVTNRPFLIFIATFFIGGIAVGMWLGLIYIYVDAYLDKGQLFAQLFLMAFIIGILAVPLWFKIVVRYGKKITWILSILLLVISFIFTGLLEPADTSFADLLALKVIQTFGFVGSGVVVPAMLSDIIDYSQLKYLSEKSATYFSVKVFFEKSGSALGVALGLMIAGFYEFDASVVEHSGHSIFGLKLAISVIPTLMGIVTIGFAALSPIDERRRCIIKRKLDQRVARDYVWNQT